VGVKRKVLNIDLAKEIYGWTQEPALLPLEEGILKTITWYKKTYLGESS
jgi:nucleoside-diphosphate-sugar epimerase